MNRYNASFGFSLLAIILIVSATIGAGQNLATAATSTDDAAATQQIQTLLNEYVKSIDTLDLGLARKVWSDQPGVAFIHPRGTERGLDQVLTNFYTKTMGLFAQRELLPDNINIHVYKDSAWSEFTWTFHATFKSNGQKITTQGRETQVYHRESGTWRIVHVHYSALPETAPAKGF